MADVIKEYAIQIQMQGSKAVIKEFKELEKVEKKQNKELKQTNSLLWTYAKRLVGIYAIYKMFKKGINLGINFAEQGNSLKMMSSMANVSAQSLQKWGNALRRFNGDSKTVASIMGSLNQKIYNRRYFNANEFSDLIRDYGAGEYLQATDAERFLIGLSKKMEAYSDVNAKNDIAFKAGITDPAMIQFLKQGSKAVMEQLKQADALFSAKDLKDAEEAKKQLAEFNLQLEKLAINLGRITLKPLTEFVIELTEFIKDPKKYLTKSFADTETSAYGVAKSMFNPLTAGAWIKNRLSGLSDFSSTTGLDFLGRSFDTLKSNVVGGNINVNNRISMNITGSNAEETAVKTGNAIANIDKSSISTATQKQAGVIR